jgi:protoporphyrinogen oxidase
MDLKKRVLVIGGGPAGLAATYSLARRAIPAVCFESDRVLGGISRTIEYKGFRFDVGGHRFFTKIPAVENLWHEILGDEFLRRPRLSRIYYDKTFFYYPLRPANALIGLGAVRSVQILGSYLMARIRPSLPEVTFEQWVSNRFGSRLYTIFFKTYTEKVWGIPCSEISAEWAAQRIKGLSLWTAVANAVRKPKKTAVKTLIGEFRYPRLGPGQMYENMGWQAERLGAAIRMRHRVKKVLHDGHSVTGLVIDHARSEIAESGTDYISTMPITELILRLQPAPPSRVVEAARALRYRSIVTVNLLLKRRETLPDTWIYVHDPEVRLGRIQFFANWSPSMVPDKDHSSVGLEYFCDEGDDLWSASDERLLALGREELARLDILDTSTVFDGFAVRMPKCYPVYSQGYSRHIETIRKYLKRFGNLQLCGRYGLFRYNNMDHSIVTALYAVENILGAAHDVWAVNADDEYHEELKNS